jgi:class 3 adenylate cyclase
MSLYIEIPAGRTEITETAMKRFEIEKQENRSIVTDQMVVIGFGLAAVYWLLDSFLSIFLSYEHFLERWLGIQLDNIWGRIIVLCMFVIFGSHAQYTINERQKAAFKMEQDAATRERFRRLLSPDLAEMVVSGALTVEKGGENRVVTVMFVDIRGFTELSTNAEAGEILKLLNDYYEIIVKVIFVHEGTVDKFIGDGIMVLWGAPIGHHDDPDRAARAALNIQSAIEDFNYTRASKGLAPVEVGIGINTGPVVAGYLGSSQTMSYSVIGDTVNMASRLCDAAQPGEVIISESTHFIVQKNFRTLARDPIMVKGKSQPVQSYSLLDVLSPRKYNG